MNIKQFSKRPVTRSDYEILRTIVRIIHEYYNTGSKRELHTIMFTEIRYLIKRLNPD